VLRGVEGLIAKENDLVLGKQAGEFCTGLGTERFAQIETADLGTDERRRRMDDERRCLTLGRGQGGGHGNSFSERDGRERRRLPRRPEVVDSARVGGANRLRAVVGASAVGEALVARRDADPRGTTRDAARVPRAAAHAARRGPVWNIHPMYV
jgi:hypothetical protein